MQYIPLSDLFGFLDQKIQPVAASEKPLLEAELKRLYDTGKSLQVKGKTVEFEQLRSFIAVLDHPGIVVFDQWIMQFSGLRQVLLDGSLSKNNFDPKIILEHRLFPDFSRFVSPFLLPRLLEKTASGEDVNMLFAATYINLLDNDAQLILQDKLASWLKNKMAVSLENAQAAKTELLLVQAMGKLVSDEMIAFVNQFTKSFYAVKIAYIDGVLGTMKFPACSHRMGNWLAGQLKKLILNPEHHEKIKEITGTVKSGKVAFSNQNGKIAVSPHALKTITWTVSFLVFAGLVYFFWFDPFGKFTNAPPPIENQSAFEQFTKEERMQIDSLIRSMTPEEMAPEEFFGDQMLHLPPADMNVIYREPFQNAKAEQFYTDCLKDQELFATGMIDSCHAYPAKKAKEKMYPAFTKLAEHTGKQAMFLKNGTVYQVLVLVFSNEKDAPVFSALMNPDDNLSFSMNPSEVILFLPGNDWAQFITSAVSPDELPSDNYKHHFCQQDENFKAMLYAPYTLKSVQEKTVKLMLNESEDTDFFLLDLHKALEIR